MNRDFISALTIEQMIKVVAVVEAIPDADEVVAFYRGLKVQSADWKEILRVLRHYECPQDPWELQQMLTFMKDSHSLLEIGSSFGGTLLRMAQVLAPHSKVVSVDLPHVDTPVALTPTVSLKSNCEKILNMGHEITLFEGNSHNPETINKVKQFKPFDFGFIDGDHSYEGVKADWENYGPMCKNVGFHDIAGSIYGCKKLWGELKEAGKYKLMEIINPHAPFGIGVVLGT